MYDVNGMSIQRARSIYRVLRAQNKPENKQALAALEDHIKTQQTKLDELHAHAFLNSGKATK